MALDFGTTLGINNAYAQYASSSASATEKMRQLQGAASSAATDDESMEACKEFEQYLVEMVLKEVAKTTNLTGITGDSSASLSTTKDLTQEQLVRLLAERITDSGKLGIAQKLYDSMNRDTVDPQV